MASTVFLADIHVSSFRFPALERSRSSAIQTMPVFVRVMACAGSPFAVLRRTHAVSNVVLRLVPFSLLADIFVVASCCQLAAWESLGFITLRSASAIFAVHAGLAGLDHSLQRTGIVDSVVTLSHRQTQDRNPTVIAFQSARLLPVPFEQYEHQERKHVAVFLVVADLPELLQLESPVHPRGHFLQAHDRRTGIVGQ